MVFLAVAAAAVAAGAIQSVAGFGAGVILMLVLPYFYDMVTAPAISSAVMLGLSAALGWKFRAHLKARHVVIPTLFCTLGNVAAVYWSQGADMRLLALGFGLFLTAMAIFFLAFSKRLKLRETVPTAVLCGSLSGVGSGLFALGGPIMTLYIVSVTEDHKEMIAYSQFIFSFTGAMATAARINAGTYGLELIPITLVGIAGINAGKYIGLRFAERIDKERFKKLVYLAVAISGILTVIQNL